MLSREDLVNQLKSNPITIPTTEPKKLTVYGYTRCSTAKQKDYGYGLDVQREEIARKCVSMGVTLKKLYSDEGVTGKKLDRKEFTQLLDRLKPGDIIIAHSLTRLARNHPKFLKFVDKMKERQVRIICIKERIDIVYDDNGEISASSKSQINIQSIFAEMELDKIQERTREGMEQLKDENGYIATRPFFGYKVTYNPDGTSKRVPDEEQQKVILFVLQCLLDNPTITVASITRLVNNQLRLGNLNYKGKKEVQHCQITAIIRNNKLR